jgi:hypothetical protein
MLNQSYNPPHSYTPTPFTNYLSGLGLVERNTNRRNAKENGNTGFLLGSGPWEVEECWRGEWQRAGSTFRIERHSVSNLSQPFQACTERYNTNFANMKTVYNANYSNLGVVPTH